MSLIIVVATVFAGCSILRSQREYVRAQYPTFAAAETDELQVCVYIVQRDRFRIVMVNRTNAQMQVDWLNAYYSNDRGETEPLMLLVPLGDNRMVSRLENTLIQPYDRTSYYLYPDPAIHGQETKGAPVTSHDERHYRVPYPTADTFIGIPVQINQKRVTVRAVFEEGTCAEDHLGECSH